MRIGLFTDTYHPSTNGVVYVVDILRHNLEKLGHEVYVFAPAPGLLAEENKDPHLIRFAALNNLLYPESSNTLFFPPSVMRRIKRLNLDAVHVFTYGQLGLMGIYAASRLDLPVVAEYCTDLAEYVRDRSFFLPVLLALGIITPVALRANLRESLDFARLSLPRQLKGWDYEMVSGMVTIVHSHCAAVIVHSRKSYKQLKGWQYGRYKYPMHIIPTGVDPLPAATQEDKRRFSKKWGLASSDEVVLFVGRLSAEKNLDILIDAMEHLLRKRPNAKLMFVGDFDYRPVLEQKAAKSGHDDRIIFTGKIPREQLGTVYGVASVFAFPSLTDTQGLVLHEAAGAGLPLVLIDHDVSEVMKNGKNGYYAKNKPVDVAAKIADILANDKKRQAMSARSREFAAQFSELEQARKISDLYQKVRSSVWHDDD